ncbi:MAG TPA: hypothetical protein VL463_28050 [Kofleriaceae bacterium]|nr:hypothetical protein [Kofleriaceae bacterium]
MAWERARVAVLVGIAALAAAPIVSAGGGGGAWIIEPTAEEQGAASAGADDVARAQQLAKQKQYVEAVQLLEQVDRAHPAAVNDCNLALAYLRAGVLTRAQLLWDVSALRNGLRPSWCLGDLSKQLSTALRAAGYVPVTIDVVPTDAVLEVGGISMRNVHVVWLAPGPYTIVARAPSLPDGSQAITVAAPSTRVAIALAAPSPPKKEIDAGVRAPDAGVHDLDSLALPDAGVAEETEPPTQWPAWAAIGGGAAVIGVGAIFHVKALSAKDDANHAYVGSTAFTDADDRFSGARTKAIVSYVIGAAAVGFGAWWWIDHHGHSRVGVEASSSGGALTLTGEF